MWPACIYAAVQDMKIIVAVVLKPRYIVNKTGYSALDDSPFDKFDDYSYILRNCSGVSLIT